jgi:uncharacterized protein YkwD
VPDCRRQEQVVKMLKNAIHHTVTKAQFLLIATAMFVMTGPPNAQGEEASAPSSQDSTADGPSEAVLEARSALQRDATALLKAALTQGKSRLIVEDRRLQGVAEQMAVAAMRGESLGRSGVRLNLWQSGVRDYEFVPFSARGEREAVVTGLKSALADAAAGWERYNNVGVAVRGEPGDFSLALVSTRRNVTFVGKGTARNQAYLGRDYESLRLYATDPAGAVGERTPSVDEGLWTMDLTTEGQGTWIFELVAEGPRGPEILALWPDKTQGEKKRGFSFSKSGRAVSVPDGTPTDAASWVRGGAPGPSRSPTPEDVTAAEQHLWGLIQATRSARGLTALQLVPAVQEAARSHAMDIGRGDSFGHHTSSGTALDRLASSGVLASRVVENVARAADVAEVHAALLASPAHRANLLDESVTGGGIGVVLQRDSRGRWSAIVSELFVELLPEVDVREAQLVDDIHRVREANGLLKLRVSSLLSKEAREAAEKIAESGGLDLSDSARQRIVDQIRFNFVSTGRVGIDLMVTNDTEAGADIKHVRGRTYDEVGVGAARLTQRIGAHPPGTLVSVFVFLER